QGLIPRIQHNSLYPTHEGPQLAVSRDHNRLVIVGTGECKTIGKRAPMFRLDFCSLPQRLTHASGRLMISGPAYRLTHLGGETCVTGSCHLVQAQGLNILVDCDAVQGNDRAVAMDDWPVPPSAIHYVLLAH